MIPIRFVIFCQFVPILFFLAAAEECDGVVHFQDQQGSIAGTFAGAWRFTVDTDGSSSVGLRVPDPTWGGTRHTDRTESNVQDIAAYRVLTDPAPSRVDDYGDHFGFQWLFWENPPDTVRVDVEIGGTAAAVIRGLVPDSSHIPGSEWCVGTPNIRPAEMADTAAAIHGALDSNALCANAGMIQGAVAFARSRHPWPEKERSFVCNAAAILRASGIATSFDLTYRIGWSTEIGGEVVKFPGGFGAQLSAWNVETGAWERCGATMTNAVLPCEILAGRVLDPDYLAPKLAADGPATLTTEYLSGVFGAAGSFQLFQERPSELLDANLSIASVCFASDTCHGLDTLGGGGDPGPVTSVEFGDAVGKERVPEVRVATPAKGRIRFHAAGAHVRRYRVYDVAGRLVDTVAGRGAVETRVLSPGVYFYRVTGGGAEAEGRVVVLR